MGGGTTTREVVDARTLLDRSFELGRSGRHEEAVVTCREAIAAYRREAEVKIVVHEPGLALTLMGLALSLQGLALWSIALDARGEAVKADLEAVAVHRQLIELNPATDRSSFASALDRLSALLAEQGDHDQALIACQEAVAQYRQVADLPSLAHALYHVAVRLGAVDRHDEALAACTEAIGYFRELDPAEYLPELADALHNGAAELYELGRYDEGLAAINEAITLRRHRPDDDGAKLAKSLRVRAVIVAKLNH
ncbi:tetratricopeptide repeat protein [Actinoplanes sp. NPDC051470]|uniref:tetratricopeptide repeat protein n=1 Tax=Actinoplanes sp. NPDC051470 TaxID=3157224 RepID=UPI0034423A6B